ncbi:MAG: MFS transporter [Candidatus Nanopelagicales bacterium]
MDGGRDLRLARVLVAYGAGAVVEYAAWIAVIFYAYDIGGATLAGIAGVVQLLPAAVIAPAAGSVGDRLPRGTALSGSYAVEALLIAVTAALLVLGAPVWAVLTASTLVTASVSVARPIHYASLPQLVRTPGALVRSNSATGVLQGVGLFVGPLLAGIVVERWSSATALGLCAVVVLLSALLTVRLRLPVASAGGDDGALRAAVAGLRVVGRDRGVLALLLALGMGYLVSGALEVLSVAFADEVLGAGSASAGLMFGASGVGALLGAALAAAVALRTRLALPVVAAIVVAGLPLMLMAEIRVLAPAVVLIAVYGLGEAIAGVTARTLLQRVTDDGLLARVFSVQEGVNLVGLALGAGLAPVLVAAFGPAAGFVPLGAGLVIAGLLCWLPLRAMDSRAVVRPDVVALLRRAEVFAAMAPPALERLAGGARWVELGADEVVIAQGETGDAYYVVGSGTLAVEVDGVRRDVLLGAGDGFGEIALLQDVPRTATVTTTSPVRLLRVERDPFLAAITGTVDGRSVAHDIAAAHLRRDAGS